MKRSRRLLLTAPLIGFWFALALPAFSQSSNYQACLSGYGYCNHSALTSAEAVEVETAEYQRNLTACTSGYGYCNHAKLNPSDLPAVETAEYQRNLSACTSGYGYCNHAKLTPSDTAEVKLGESNRVQIDHGSARAASPGVAENGSYYGELNANGVPKTVHVNGYYRRDGTYVQGHYRSAPGTNPPRTH